jgi:hypothetical protein
MTIQINIGDHTPTGANTATFMAVPNRLLADVRWARTKAIQIARTIPSADVYFRSLPNGRSLTALLADNTIWINYDPTSTDFGLTNLVSGNEIAICNPSFRIGRWTVLATLVHELAHVNGAPLPPSKAAERAVLECGMGYRSELTTGIDDPRTPYNQNISG